MKFDESNPKHIKSLDRYSFPYNGEEVDKYLDRLKEYRPFIHDIFFSLPDIPDFFSSYISKIQSNYNERCKEMLEETKEEAIRIVVTVNGNYIKFSFSEKEDIAKKVIEMVDRYNIYGVVLSDYNIAEMIHKENSTVVINTSCNVPQYKVSHLNHWRKYCGVELINPPRDTGKDIKLLKEFKEAGYKIKLLVNELCHYKCPNICSYCNISSGNKDTLCTNTKYEESPLLSCFIPPRWLDKYDEIVDIYKITGRYLSTDCIFKWLEVYINREDFVLSLSNNIAFPTKLIPDKQLSCGMKDCDNCKMCL